MLFCIIYHVAMIKYVSLHLLYYRVFAQLKRLLEDCIQKQVQGKEAIKKYGNNNMMKLLNKITFFSYS